VTFISLDYLFIYLPVVVGLYLVFRKTFLANVIVMVASYVFYAAAAVWYLVPFDRFLTVRLGVVGKWIAIVLTFHIVCFGWILFRAHTNTIMPLLSSIPAMYGATYAQLPLFRIYGRVVAVLGAATLLTDYLGYRKGGEFTDLFKALNPYVSAALAVACYFGIVLLAKREGAQFIYFQF
jgi:alginate O-acetyltransferase complex protein AlgI